jgi:two-component system response regulator DesR
MCVDLDQALQHAPAEVLPANPVPHPRDALVPESITVLLVEDLDLLRGALVSLLSAEPDIDVVDALSSTNPVIPVAQRLRPSVIIVDLDPLASGLTLITELRHWLPASQIVALTSAKPAGLIRCLLAADVLGAIDNNAPAALLLEAIRGAARGQLVFDATLILAALTASPNPLTPREMDVLRLAAEGVTGPEIARRLYLSPGTIRNHLSRVITKTKARTTVDAVRIAADAGWL